MDTPQLSVGDIGPLADCRSCRHQVATFLDINAGQWELRCFECGRTVKRLNTTRALEEEAHDVRPLANRRPPQHKERV